MKKISLLTLLICIEITRAQTIITVAGNGYCCGGIDGIPATTSAVYYPEGVAVDPSGNIFISEANKIRKVNTSGIITTYAGSTGGYSGDGGPATSALLETSAVAVDAVGNVYTADWSHNVIRKINTAGIISTIAGNGTSGFSGDGGLAINSKIASPYGLAVDGAGNIYFSDSDNQRIRKINTAGIITTVAGSGPGAFSGDGGPATLAKLSDPIGITLDAAGNLYIADWQNDRIRKVNTSGIITTIAGIGTTGFSGDGGPALAAELNSPSSVTCDNSGNLFIGDESNFRVRMVNSSGIITTIAGSTYGFSGDGGPAIAAEFTQPWNICSDISGNIYVADRYNHRIRKISNTTAIFESLPNDKQITIFPNPVSASAIIKINERLKLKNPEMKILDVMGRNVKTIKTFQSNEILFDREQLPAGIYFYQLTEGEQIFTGKFVIQ